jgi:hypothetical protein
MVQAPVMLRTLLVGLLCGIVCGCANGWPTARHPGPSSARAATAQNCTPTTSHIARSDCATNTPGSQSSGDDLERTRSTLPNGGNLGSISAPH